jgi:iron complex outermembrane receptor protein
LLVQKFLFSKIVVQPRPRKESRRHLTAAADAPTVNLAAIDQVTVVGSRARNRTVFDSAVPIDRFGAREVENALTRGDLGAALQQLAPSINFPRIESSGAADSVRGLGPDHVLVLVNGKRCHAIAVLDTESSFAGIVPVDVNTIPPGAIDHIEILRDGAGAQYGSDAVAGVINIVLKKARAGGSAPVSYGANHTDFEPTDESHMRRPGNCSATDYTFAFSTSAFDLTSTGFLLDFE